MYPTATWRQPTDQGRKRVQSFLLAAHQAQLDGRKLTRFLFVDGGSNRVVASIF